MVLALLKLKEKSVSFFPFSLQRNSTVKWSLCHTCDSHQKRIDGLIIWRTCEERHRHRTTIWGAHYVCLHPTVHGRSAPGSPWPHRSLPGIQAHTAPSPPPPAFICNVCFLLVLKLMWLLKAYRKTLLLSQQHLKGHIPNLITIFPLLKSCPFYCFIGSNAATLEPTLEQSIYTPKQAFKQTNKAEEMPVSSPTQIKLRDTFSGIYRTIQRSNIMPLWLVSTLPPGLITDSRQINALVLRDEENSLIAREYSRLYPTREPTARSRLRANTGALFCSTSEMKPCRVPPSSTKSATQSKCLI